MGDTQGAELKEKDGQLTELQEGHAQIQSIIEQMTLERSRLQSALERSVDAETAYDACLEQLSRQADPDPDTITSADSVVAEQLAELVAKDQALDDVIYHLGKALDSGTISLPDYLKGLRRVGQQQFLTRAHCLKIRQVLDRAGR